MRILNRPMFKYGGPIKEGVMHGMRNNYQSGQLVQPGPGRPGYKGPPTTKVGMAGWLATKLPWWSKIVKGTKDIIPKTTQVVKGVPKNLQGIFTQTGTSPGVTGSGAGQQFLKNLKSFPGASKIPGWATKAKDIAFKYPKSTAAGVLYGGPTVIGGVKQIPWSKIGQGLDPRPGWRKVFGIEDKIDEKDGTDTLTEKITETGVPGGGSGMRGTGEWFAAQEAEAAKKLAQEQQNERLKSYLDMMGYDSAKKTAMSDALIDASALVQDATTEAGSLKKADWGSLINRAIQTTSKRLDKPEQIREAVGLMMTKGEIEKDIAEGKGSQYDVKEKYLTGKLGQVAGQRAALQKPTSLSEAVNATKGTDSKGDRTNQALRSYFDGYLTPTFKGKISKKKIDALGGEDLLEEGMEIALDNGVYQISKSYIIVEGNKIIEADDVFSGD